MPPRPRIGLVDPVPFVPTSHPSPICTRCLQRVATGQSSRSFSTTPAPKATKMRRDMWRWLEGPGKAFQHPLPGSTNYLGAYNKAGELVRAKNREADAPKATAENEEAEADEEGGSEEGRAAERNENGLPRERMADLTPFPQNRNFRSQPVLSEQHKDAIYTLIKQQGKSVREVSNLLGVDMRRVAAVIRLKGVEQDWIKKGKPLAHEYDRAMLRMLPVTRFEPLRSPVMERAVHEPTNELNTHRATKAQIFLPAAESRQFTRRDAGEVLERGLLPADERIPHPELIDYYRDAARSKLREDREERLRAAYATEAAADRDARDAARAREARNVTTVEGPRANFRVQNVVVDELTVGKDGRGRRGVGARYGLPPQDRKKGQVKIPTKV